MSYWIKTEGLDEFSQKLFGLENAAQGVAAAALFVGAGITADAVSQAVHGIATAPFKYAKEGQRMPSPEEKAILENAPKGIAKFRRNGISVDTSVGFIKGGYAAVNWNHMSGKGRTNYKAKKFKDFDSATASTLKFAGTYERGLQNQKPIEVIANSINSGTSFMKKQPFFRKAVNAAKAKAVSAMDEELRERIEKIAS